MFILDSSRLQQRWLTVEQRELLMGVCSVLDDERALLMKSIIGGLRLELLMLCKQLALAVDGVLIISAY